MAALLRAADKKGAALQRPRHRSKRKGLAAAAFAAAPAITAAAASAAAPTAAPAAAAIAFRPLPRRAGGLAASAGAVNVEELIVVEITHPIFSLLCHGSRETASRVN